ncbi:hypothetical protein [Kitasatospora sp. NPDC002965]
MSDRVRTPRRRRLLRCSPPHSSVDCAIDHHPARRGPATARVRRRSS